MKKILTPFKSVKNNLLMTKTGNCWAYYQLPPVTIFENDLEKVEQYKNRLSKAFFEIGSYSDWHIQLIPQDSRLKEKFEELSKDFDPDYRELGEKYLDRTYNLLREELGDITEYIMILAVKLTPPLVISEEKLSKNIKQAVYSVKNKLYSGLQVEVKTTEEDFLQYEQSEKELYNSLQHIAIERLTNKKIKKLHEFSFLKGVDLGNSQNVVIDTAERSGVIKIITSEEIFYITVLPIADTEDIINNLELFKFSQSFNFHTELHIKGRTESQAKVKRKILFTGNRFKQTDREMYQNEDEDDEIVKGKEYINHLRNKTTNDNVPLFEWVGAFIIKGNSIEEVQQRSKIVKNTMRQNYKVELVQPVADQLQLFYKFLQGQTLDLSEKYWTQYTTNQELGEFCFGLTKQLGTYIGFYLGRITSGHSVSNRVAIANSINIVLWHSFLAHEGIEGAITDSPHSAILGQTGKGKSYLVKLLFFYAMFLKGKTILTDPKSEFKERIMSAKNDPTILENYPEFLELVDKIKFITLNADNADNFGILDPLNFLEGTKAKDTIFDIFSSLFNVQDQRTDNQLRREVDYVIKQKTSGENVGLMSIIDRLETNEDENVKLLGENIRLRVENSILRLIFGHGNNKNDISIRDKVSILEIEGLDLPDSKTPTSDQSETEQKSIAVMIALAKFCEEFGKRDKHEKTTIIFDEAWTLTTAKGGKKLLKQLRRVGRSYANQLILVTQSVDDIQDDDDSGNFGASFYFDESSEREKILRSIGLPVTDSNIELLSDLKKGQCLFRDFYGRIGELSIDCPYPEWDKAFETVDKSNSGTAEKEFSR